MSDGNVWQRLEGLAPDRITPGLDRIRALLGRLGDPQHAFPTTIVAGTNGKGSSVAMLSSIGRVAGVRVGCYTSPHLLSLTERFQIDGHPISREGLGSHLDAVLTAADALVAAGDVDHHPSYFEILTAVAFRYFAEARVDLAVLEVGLGGRLDATNVTTPRVAIITPISLDHTDWLGHDIRQIALEKFAVVPRSGVAVVAPQRPEVMETIRRCAQDRRVTLVEAEAYPLEFRGHDERMCFSFDLDGRLRHYRGLQLSLPGRHQVENARTVILAAEALDRRRMRVASDAIWAGLRRAHLPGRCDWIDGTPPALLDGAHNPAAAEQLAAYLASLRAAGTFERLHMVIGALRDKDLAGIALTLFPQADSVFATVPPSTRAAPAEELLAAGTAPARAEAIPVPEAALARALEVAGPRDLICITGSLYLLGRLRPLLDPAEHE
jgi:dihydrofolate synthase/folylpolyglutamate synthase